MIRVAIADDHEVVRAGFKMVLEQDPSIRVVGEAADGSQAYALVAREHPDVLLLDISMPPGQSGLVACKDISQDFPDTRIVIVTMFSEPEYLRFTIKGGACGYLLKTASPEELRRAVYTVMEGDIYVHLKMAELLKASNETEEGRAQSNALQKLTARELEVLQLLAMGFTNKEIAAKIFLSVKTVEAHRAHIYSKMGFKSRADLVSFALAHKLMDV